MPSLGLFWRAWLCFFMILRIRHKYIVARSKR
jgi:hypothetical protein